MLAPYFPLALFIHSALLFPIYATEFWLRFLMIICSEFDKFIDYVKI